MARAQVIDALATFPAAVAQCASKYTVGGSMACVHGPRNRHPRGSQPGAWPLMPRLHRRVRGHGRDSCRVDRRLIGGRPWCPRAACVHGGRTPTAWVGREAIATVDSSMCASADHRGVVTRDPGGRVSVEVTEGQAAYGLGTTALSSRVGPGIRRGVDRSSSTPHRMRPHSR